MDVAVDGADHRHVVLRAAGAAADPGERAHDRREAVQRSYPDGAFAFKLFIIINIIILVERLQMNTRIIVV